MMLLPVSNVTLYWGNDAPDPVGCKTAAVEVMPRIRPAVSQKSQLFTKETKDIATVSGRARAHRERRDAERVLYDELSRYYPAPGRVWGKEKLLTEGKQRTYSMGRRRVTHPFSYQW